MSIITDSTTVSAVQVRQKLGELLDKAYYRGESFIVERAGEAKAVIVPLVEYQQMTRLRRAARERFSVMTEELRAAFADEDPQTVDGEIAQAIKAVRSQNPGT